jgi:hypothetical protein
VLYIVIYITFAACDSPNVHSLITHDVCSIVDNAHFLIFVTTISFFNYGGFRIMSMIVLKYLNYQYSYGSRLDKYFFDGTFNIFFACQRYTCQKCSYMYLSCVKTSRSRLVSILIPNINLYTLRDTRTRKY